MPARVKAIIPSAFNPNVFGKEFRSAMERTVKAERAAFESTTKTWDHVVNFIDSIVVTETEIKGAVATFDPIYGYVNDGTPPHVIVPVRAQVLAFPGTFQSKTMPGVIDSRAGQKGGPLIFARAVNHPGTEARNFDEVIAERMEDVFYDEMEKAINAAVRSCGHAFE